MAVSDSAVGWSWLSGVWRERFRQIAPAWMGRRAAPRRPSRSGTGRPPFSRLRWTLEPETRLSLDAPLGPPATVVPPASRRLAQAPPWLVSLTLHLSAVLLLAIWAIPQPQGSSPHVVTLSSVDPSASQPLESLPALQFELPGEPIPAEQRTIPATVDLPQSAEPVVLDVAAFDGALHSSPFADIDALLASSDGGLASIGDKLPGAEFFGVQAQGSKFVFVVDSSNSMRQGKLDAAKVELLYSIRRLSSYQSFYVIFFNGNTVPMSLGDTGEPEPAPLLATTENILKLEAWVDTVDVDPWTDPHEAMQKAVAMLPDAIYLLSDGRFTDRGKTIRFLKRKNYVRDAKGRRPKVVVHTVGFHQRDGEPTLKSIARSYGGTYRFVPPPK